MDDLVDAPMEGDGAGGGAITVTDDEEVGESLEDLAVRVREIEAMRHEDGGESPTEQYTPTAVGDGDESIMSPLMQLKRMVDGEAASSSRSELPPVAMQVDKDEYDMILSEQQKLRKFVPESIRMPWERGFAGLVLNRQVNIIPLECLKESSRSAKFMEVQVDPPGEPQVATQVKSSFVSKERTRLPWDRAQTEEGDKVLAGWQVVIRR